MWIHTFDEPVEVHAGQAKKHGVGPLFSATNEEARRSRQQRKGNGEVMQGIGLGGLDDHGHTLVFNRDHGRCAFGDRGQASGGRAGAAGEDAGGGLPAQGRRLRSRLGGHGRGHAGTRGRVKGWVGSGGDGEAMAVVNQESCFCARNAVWRMLCVFHMHTHHSDVPGHLDSRRTSRQICNEPCMTGHSDFISTIHTHLQFWILI